jgi:hypothetical protein
VLEAEQHRRADHAAPEMAHAPQDHHDHQGARLQPMQDVRVHVFAMARKQRSGQPAGSAGDDEARELVAVHRQADGGGARLVLADGDHHPAEARVHETVQGIQH